MDDINSIPRFVFFAIHELCSPQIWGSWNGCLEVRHLLKLFVLVSIFTMSRSLPPLVLALAPGQQRSLDKLKAMRIHLAGEVANLINDFGPKVYENFDEVPPVTTSPSACSDAPYRLVL